MCTSRPKTPEPVPTPSVVPGVTNVSTGVSEDAQTARSQYMDKARKRKGFASTVRNTGGMQGIADNQTGKTQLGQ